jgi:hypothetical protein
MLHWGQATMFKGLSHLILRLSPENTAAKTVKPPEYSEVR